LVDAGSASSTIALAAPSSTGKVRQVKFAK